MSTPYKSVFDENTMFAKLQSVPLGDESRMLNVATSINKDAVGVAVVQYIFQTLIDHINQEFGKQSKKQPQASATMWNVRKENPNAQTRFSSLRDIPSPSYDYGATFKTHFCKPKDSKKAGTWTPPTPSASLLMDASSNVYLDDKCPKWMSRPILESDFYKHITYQEPDGVFRIEYVDCTGKPQRCRVFVEVDGQDKSKTSPLLKLGQCLYEACDACFELNPHAPAFTIRLNYAYYLQSTEEHLIRTKALEKGSDNLALQLFFESFKSVTATVATILSKIHFFKEEIKSDTMPSYHYFINMRCVPENPYELVDDLHAQWYDKGDARPIFKLEDDSNQETERIIDQLAHMDRDEFVVKSVQPNVDYLELRHKLDRHARPDIDTENQFWGTTKFWQTYLLLPHHIDEIIQLNRLATQSIDLKMDYKKTKTYYTTNNLKWLYFDQPWFRILEQVVVYEQNYLCALSQKFEWGKGAARWSPMDWVWLKLIEAVNNDVDAFMSRQTIPLSRTEYENNMSFKPGSKSLQGMICQKMHTTLPALDNDLQRWIESFNIPNAALFLRIIRCNNLIALRQLATQYFAGDMLDTVNTVLRQMPVCTESEMRWLFRHIMHNEFWLNTSNINPKNDTQQNDKPQEGSSNGQANFDACAVFAALAHEEQGDKVEHTTGRLFAEMSLDRDEDVVFHVGQAISASVSSAPTSASVSSADSFNEEMNLILSEMDAIFNQVKRD